MYWTIVVLQFCAVILADYCGENKVPFGLEVHRNGQPSLLCARPNCEERKFTVSCFLLLIFLLERILCYHKGFFKFDILSLLMPQLKNYL